MTFYILLAAVPTVLSALLAALKKMNLLKLTWHQVLFPIYLTLLIVGFFGLGLLFLSLGDAGL